MNSISYSEDIVLFLFSALIMWSYILIIDKLYHADGRVGVKSVFMREAWLKAVDRCMNGGSYAVKCARTRSIKYETTRTGAEFSGEDFQKVGTFMVLKTSVFVISSPQTSPLARDAYNAVWDGKRWRQERNCSLATGN